MKRAFSSSSSSSSSGPRVLLEKISARVFCPETAGKGGNPVTVFCTVNGERLSQTTQQQLARSCAWESVMVHDKGLSFYMPTGKEVSFCAHACMAGGIRIAADLEQATPITCHYNNNDNPQPTSRPEITVHEDDIVTLAIQGASFEQTAIVDNADMALLYRLLRDSCGLELEHLPTRKETIYPTFVHVSVARPKTLVYVKNPTALIQLCHTPPDPVVFERACHILQETTGLYLYTHHPERDGVFLCRQFPAASGYPEDPATGIAAAALAGSLALDLPFYKFRQGCTAGSSSLTDQDMLDPEMSSLLMVEELKLRPLADDDVITDMDEVTRTPTTEELRAEENQTQTKGLIDYKLIGKIEIDDMTELELENTPDHPAHDQPPNKEN